MLIVAGHLQVEVDRRDEYLAVAGAATRLARETPGCLDFVQAADPLVPGRIVIFERWESEAELIAFRESDPVDDAPVLPKVVAADVKRYEISGVGPA